MALVNGTLHVAQPVHALGQKGGQRFPFQRHHAPFAALPDAGVQRQRLPVVVAPTFRLIEAGHGAPHLLPALQRLVAGGGGPGERIAGAGRVVVLAGLARRPG